MDLDFLEIGTSNFNTHIQSCSDEQVGISVEPLKFYLDDLPNKTNVKKICAAITYNKVLDNINIFYIPPDVVDKHNLPQWFKGCNRIGNYHTYHTVHGVEHLVKIESIPLLNVEELLTQENIKTIKYLKIDTEGHDCIIMEGFYNYLKEKSTDYFPRHITFESNEHSNQNKVTDIIQKFTNLGYTLVQRGYDTILKFDSSSPEV